MSSSKDSAVQQPLQYADEVLCANWNPLALLVAEPAKHAVSRVVDAGDVEALLARVYRCQQA